MKANQTEIKRLMGTVRGQLDGIMKMIEEDKYCIDVSNQIFAAISILKKINLEILDAHLHGCVLNASMEEKEIKLTEISAVLKRVLR